MQTGNNLNGEISKGLMVLMMLMLDMKSWLIHNGVKIEIGVYQYAYRYENIS